MRDPVELQKAQPEPQGAGGSARRKDRRSLRLGIDAAARRIVTLGGLTIIVAILGIFIVVAVEALPLLRGARVTADSRKASTPISGALAVTEDEYREVALLVTGRNLLVARRVGGETEVLDLAPLRQATITSVSTINKGPFAVGTSDGRVIPVEVSFQTSYADKGRTVEAGAAAGEPLDAGVDGRSVRLVAYSGSGSETVAVAVAGDRELRVMRITEVRALVGEATRQATRAPLDIPGVERITAIAVDGRGEDLFVGTGSGELVRVDMRSPSAPVIAERVRVVGGTTPITALGFLIGDRTLVCGAADGAVSTWQVLQDEGGPRQLRRIHDYARHSAAVIAFSASRRDKGFVTGDAAGEIHLGYGTTGATLATFSASAPFVALAFAPKADGVVAADGTGKFWGWDVGNPHPEVTLKALFGKVWYEGYSAPAYVWQSTGGSDDFEAKFSLTPLLFGTLKGTFYALVLAIPLALLAALYASQFMHPRLRSRVKPVVEIMAALPSVVLGFLAGLWLAPALERHFPAFVVLPWVLAGGALLAMLAWRLIPQSTRNRLPAGTEIVALIAVVLCGVWGSTQLGPVLERWLLAGDYRSWVANALGLAYDQRNSFVVGIAMGFAVVPIIFTIAEDSLSNVPAHLTVGSLALGASRWQTAVNVVLPTASPGIFSAIMIGFGRAVGETMIVLMATGNTPVMNLSPFNGFRALSANIAVELPEAPEGGTLYRVLFLAALLLFVMTFIVNTLAELVRIQLRKRYRYL